jgi:hypothetical protein
MFTWKLIICIFALAVLLAVVLIIAIYLYVDMKFTQTTHDACSVAPRNKTPKQE